MKHRMILLFVLLFFAMLLSSAFAEPEGCIKINPSNVTTQNIAGIFMVVDGSRPIAVFGNRPDAQANAQKAVAIIRHYNMRAFCANVISYFKTDTSLGVPAGQFQGEDALPFNPQDLRVQKINGSWKVTANNMWLLDYGNSENNAKKAVQWIKNYGFQYICYVGRPHPGLIYFRKDPVQVPLDIVRLHAPILKFHPNEGHQCCFPSDAEIAYRLIKNNQFNENREPKQLRNNAPCYFQYSKSGQFERIKYWFWYNYNDFPNGPIFGSHKGDWESVEVILSNRVPVKYYLSNHTNALELNSNQVIRPNGRINVWVGNGSHAHYPSVTYPVYSNFGQKDEIADGGAIWDIFNLKNMNDTRFGKDEYVGNFGDPASPVGRQFQYKFGY